MNPVIRPYRFSDRASVRKICSDTADLGSPVENFFHDREIFADLITTYYTDFEPQLVWVADFQEKAVGYLTGCLDNLRYRQIMLYRIIPGVFSRAILRGVFWRQDTWRVLKAMFTNYRLGGFKRKNLFKDYPAHLHINIVGGFRHQGLGQALVEKFLTQAKQAHSAGVQASVSQDNQPACNFFSRLGFSVLGRYPMFRPKEKAGFRPVTP